MSAKAHNLLGRQFGRLKVIEQESRQVKISRRIFCKCLCECGTVKWIEGGLLTRGRNKSCGCLLKDKKDEFKTSRLTHGENLNGKKTPEYRAWFHIHDRCTNSKNRSWHRYGGRGIIICAKWRNDFLSFLADVGRRPSSKHSIDRFPNKNGNYEPGNVRWATQIEQMQNCSTNVNITINGETHCLSEWARILGVSKSTLQKRYRTGRWPSQPVR